MTRNGGSEVRCRCRIRNNDDLRADVYWGATTPRTASHLTHQIILERPNPRKLLGFGNVCRLIESAQAFGRR